MRSNTQTNPIERDVQGVISDAQELLKTVQEEGGAKLAEVRSKVRSQVDSARETLGDLQQTVQDGAKLAARNTDAYVRSNPWSAVGMGAALGAIIGYLAGRR
jgi:ElaB/YqjD/DUF883 family membrane-anchored ribosome-binding protein